MDLTAIVVSTPDDCDHLITERDLVPAAVAAAMNHQSSSSPSPLKSCNNTCDASGLDLQVKKPRLDNNPMVVDELDDHSSELVDSKSSSEKSLLQQSASEYFEFMKGSESEDDFQHSTSCHLVDKMNKDSSVPNTPVENREKDGLGGPTTQEQQQYYIAVDARTVATLQAGAEYTLVPVESKGPNDDHQQPSFDDDRSWSSTENGLKVETQTQPLLSQSQPLLSQSMRSSITNDRSPPMPCSQQDSTHSSPATTTSSTTSSETSFATLSSSIFTTNNSEESRPSPGSRKSLHPLPPNLPLHQQLTKNPCIPSDIATTTATTPIPSQMTFATRLHTPTSTPGTYPLMATPHPHLMYNTPHHSNSSGSSLGFPGHRLHLSSSANAWPSPYPQNFATSHSGQSFMTPTNTSTVSNINLNSSGEEAENISPEYPRVPHNTPNSDAGLFPVTGIQRPPLMSQLLGPLDNMQYFPIPYTGRENHNEKERKRRSRIKNACSLLRDLVPGLSEKTDKATVFEYTVQYLLHLKRHVGKQFDKEFMEKYTPY